MLVDAAQIAAPQGDAVAIEEFEDLDRDLAAVVEPVAELRGGELRRSAASRRDRRRCRPSRRRSRAERNDRARPRRPGPCGRAASAGAARRPRAAPSNVGDVAHARRPEALGAAEQRRDSSPRAFRPPASAGPRGRAAAPRRRRARPRSAARKPLQHRHERPAPAGAARAAGAAARGRCPADRDCRRGRSAASPAALRLKRSQTGADSANVARRAVAG